MLSLVALLDLLIVWRKSFRFFLTISEDEEEPTIKEEAEDEANKPEVAGLVRPGLWASGQLDRGAAADFRQGCTYQEYHDNREEEHKQCYKEIGRTSHSAHSWLLDLLPPWLRVWCLKIPRGRG